MYEHNAIVLYNVSKMYKLFKSKKSKILSLLGIPTKNYEEFWALRDINLKIKKGEKVGFIGKNGAGKTTLLGIIAGNIKPTSGNLLINGKVNALFTLGTGFHPEFTGRENIISSLAYQGITGSEAKKIMDEIIEFTELEDFIDQPVKTYSAGMYMRLAFAVATAIKPEILIIDEILGVGDAYFNNKALERMSELTSGGATVLFVSHDLSSVQKICDRVIWLKKGKIEKDGEALEVVKSYLFEVRKEEELRLKAKNLGISKKSLLQDLSKEQVILRFIGENGNLPINGVAIDKIQCFYRDEMISEIDVGAPQDNDILSDAYLITDREKINWSEPVKINGRWVRLAKDIGGKYKHAVAVFNIPREFAKELISFKVSYLNNSNIPILFQIYDNNEYKTLGTLDSKSNYFVEKEFKLDVISNEKQIDKQEVFVESEKNSNPEVIENIEQEDNIDIYGSGEIKITEFEILDSKMTEKYIFTVGEEINFKITYEKKDNVKVENPVVLIAIYDMKGDCISQIISIEKNFYIPFMKDKGTIQIHVPCLRIGEGEYLISVGIFKYMNLIDPIEPPAYCILDRKYKIKIVQPINVNMNLGKVYLDAVFKIGDIE